MRGGVGIGGLIGAAAVGGLAYSAIDSMRDPNLVAEDPEALKEEAIMAREGGDTGATSAIQEQITAQKRDVKLQAGATAAGGAGAVAGAVAAKKIGQTAVVKNVKSKAWDLFLGFVKKKAPKLFAKIGARLALAGGMAVVPGIGWVSAIVTVVGSLWMAYDLYQLWNEFSALSDAEKELYDEKIEKIKSTGEVKPGAPTPVNENAKPVVVAAANKSMLPGSSTVAAATTTAAAIPTAPRAASAPAPRSPPPTTGAGVTGAGVVSSTNQVTSSVANIFSGPSPKLDQVTTKQSGVDTANIQQGMKDRVARMAKAFKEVTGKTLLVTSGYRSDDKQMQLWSAKYNSMKAANPNASEAQLIKMTRKWVALPIALGGRGSAHNRGTAVDINSKGASSIDAINGMTYNGQKVTTNSFLSMFGLARPLGHEPWHVQPLEGAPTPDNPDPNATPLVADSKGKMVNLETGKSESIPPIAPITAQTQKESLPSVSDSAAAAPADPLATMSDGTAVDSKPMMAAAPPAAAAPSMVAAAPYDGAQLTPVASTTGDQVAQGSAQLASSQMAAQAAPPPAAPMVVNNSSGGGGKQATPPPNQPMQKASTRSDENAFNRAISRDFAHPTSFTSAIIA